MKRLIISGLAALALIGIPVSGAPGAQAASGYGCESIRWGFLGSQWRTICDGPRRPAPGRAARGAEPARAAVARATVRA